MKNIIKKTAKFIFSRAFYLFIGLFLSVGIYSVYAAWNDTVSPNDPLTATIWNEHVQKLIELDNRIILLESGKVDKVNLYQCPYNLSHHAGTWATFGCLGQISTRNTCGNYSWPLGWITFICTPL